MHCESQVGMQGLLFYVWLLNKESDFTRIGIYVCIYVYMYVVVLFVRAGPIRIF